jgi:hypothetical protein
MPVTLFQWPKERITSCCELQILTLPSIIAEAYYYKYVLQFYRAISYLCYYLQSMLFKQFFSFYYIQFVFLTPSFHFMGKVRFKPISY